MKERRTVTIHEVAKSAGVSIGTVSKVMNGTGTLAAATREKVLAVAKKLRFRPNALAQSLHTGISGAIGLISNDNFGRFTMPIMEGLERELSKQGTGVFLCNATDDPKRENAHIEQLLGKQIDGLVVTARRADRRPTVNLQGIGIPVIYVFSSSEDADALTLLPDDEGGAYQGVEHLLTLGRQRIAHITGPKNFEAVRLRQKGYTKALKQASLKARPVQYGTWSEAWGREAMQKIYANPSDLPDAVLCGNDQIARGCADWLREAGHSVPNDVAIVGFDNWDVIALACRPPLTSVDLQLNELGAEAGRRMISMIEGNNNITGIQRLPCQLVMRESSTSGSKK